jgi:hypothetical protein
VSFNEKLPEEVGEQATQVFNTLLKQNAKVNAKVSEDRSSGREPGAKNKN